jgi:hypothetical protein
MFSRRLKSSRGCFPEPIRKLAPKMGVGVVITAAAGVSLSCFVLNL